MSAEVELVEPAVPVAVPGDEEGILPPIMPLQLGVQVTDATPPPIMSVFAKAGAAMASKAAAATPMVLIMDMRVPQGHNQTKLSALRLHHIKVKRNLPESKQQIFSGIVSKATQPSLWVELGSNNSPKWGDLSTVGASRRREPWRSVWPTFRKMLR